MKPTCCTLFSDQNTPQSSLCSRLRPDLFYFFFFLPLQSHSMQFGILWHFARCQLLFLRCPFPGSCRKIPGNFDVKSLYFKIVYPLPSLCRGHGLPHICRVSVSMFHATQKNLPFFSIERCKLLVTLHRIKSYVHILNTFSCSDWLNLHRPFCKSGLSVCQGHFLWRFFMELSV